MTVEELVERLRECSPEAQVVLCILQDYGVDIKYGNVIDVVDTEDYVILKSLKER